MRWRIYYIDGSTFSDQEGAPHAAPLLGVQVIVQRREDSSDLMLMHAADFYFHRTYLDDFAEWYQAKTQSDLNNQLYHHAHAINAVRYGQTARNSVFEIIMKRARRDKLV